MTTYFTVQTFGTPSIGFLPYYRIERKAIRAAGWAKGTGTCSVARVYAHNSLKLAKSADISIVRDGEQVIFEA